MQANPAKKRGLAFLVSIGYKIGLMATELEKAMILKEYFRERASRAGTARRNKLSPEERKRIAKLAAQARWKKKNGGPDGSGSPGSNGGSLGSASDNTKDYVNRRRPPCRITRLSLPLFDQEFKRAA